MKTLFENYPELVLIKPDIEKAIDILTNAYKNNGKILICGNGGSASDSAHIVGELMKGFMNKRPLDKNLMEELNKQSDDSMLGNKLQKGIPCIDLTAQSSLISAFANDVDADLVYAQQVLAYSLNNPNDVVIGLSTSGNSKNVVRAFEVAKVLKLKTISFTGNHTNKLEEISSVCIKAPAEETFRVQEYHLPIYHYICQELEKRI